MKKWVPVLSKVAGFFILAIAAVAYFMMAGLIIPAYALPFLWAIWVAAAVFTVRWRKVPKRVVGVPVASLVIFFVIATLGDLLLGWTA